jgi:prepilin signal peptidase PulO-like enzyme (type II secretory pathway)
MTLNKLAKKGLIPKTIAIKESMPFVPTMLLGYIFCLILGDLVFILLGVI